jgi:hypothetical protein
LTGEADEADEEYFCTTGLSDADILEAFLRDGCDLDGTPLWLKNEDRISRSTFHTTRRLH